MSPKESITNDRVVSVIEKGVKKEGVRGLARSTGLSPAIITRYMQGKVGEPTAATLEKIAAYSGVSVNWLRSGGYRYRKEEVKGFLKGANDAVLLYGAAPKHLKRSAALLAYYLHEAICNSYAFDSEDMEIFDECTKKLETIPGVGDMDFDWESYLNDSSADLTDEEIPEWT